LFGIGMPKTGTCSLVKACRDMGLTAIHFPQMHEIKHVDMTNDLPITAHYQELDIQYPGSKFILTIRDQTTWETSFENHLEMRKAKDKCSGFINIPNYLHRLKLYGTNDLTMPVAIQTKKMHEKEVIAYFKSRPGDLLVMNIPDGDGWDKICSFISFPIPEHPFPHLHKTKIG